MTTTRATRPTARSLLFEDAPVDGLAAALADTEAVRDGFRGVRLLGAPALDAVNAEVAGMAEGLLEIDLGDALVMGWQKHAALVDAARRTREDPTAEEVVVLASHRVTSQHEPSVDLVVDGHVVNSFEFDLTIVLAVEGVSAVVRDGCLAALRSGRCDVSVSVRLEGATLAERQRSFDAAVLLPLPRPVSLATPTGPVLPRQVARTERAGSEGVLPTP